MILPLVNSTLTFEIDDEDYSKLLEHNNKFYIRKKNIDLYSLKTGKRYRIARIVLGCPSDNGLDAEHKDRNIFNNKKDNLRWATFSQNQANTVKTFLPTSSKYKGVFRDLERSKWAARIRLGAKVRKFLGRFDVEEDAAKAYDAEAFKHFGEFARLNFPAVK